jgi:FKBP-type peptidyl-prolyl cis-trans isomerase SlyD
MKTVSKVLAIEYSLIDANTKEELDSNIGMAPLEFITGMGQIIEGLEQQLVDMEVNENADVLVKPNEGYGEYNEEAIQTLPKEQFAGIDLVEGMSLYGTGENGETIQVSVKSLGEDDVTIDYNHPMAGRDLMFNVTLISSRDATDEELQTGVVGGLDAMDSCGCGTGSCSDH